MPSASCATPSSARSRTDERRFWPRYRCLWPRALNERCRPAGDDLGGQLIGQLAGGAAGGAGALGDLADGVVDAAGLDARLFSVVARELLGDVDEAAGVDGVVGGVEDAAALKFVVEVGVLKLVVGGSGD